MLIHSIIPNEIIFENNQIEVQQTQCITMNHCVLEVTPVEGDQYRINRIISASLKDYLDPGMQPGNIIRFSGEFGVTRGGK